MVYPEKKMVDLAGLIPKLILLRESMGLSQRELAKKMNRSQTYVSKLEGQTMSRNLTLEVLQEYLGALKCSLELVIRDKDYQEVLRIWR